MPKVLAIGPTAYSDRAYEFFYVTIPPIRSHLSHLHILPKDIQKHSYFSMHTVDYRQSPNLFYPTFKLLFRKEFPLPFINQSQQCCHSHAKSPLFFPRRCLRFFHSYARYAVGFPLKNLPFHM